MRFIEILLFNLQSFVMDFFVLELLPNLFFCIVHMYYVNDIFLNCSKDLFKMYIFRLEIYLIKCTLSYNFFILKYLQISLKLDSN